jgi:excisionase family DNA binding protein
MPEDHLSPAVRAAVDRANRIAYSPAEAAAELGCSRQTIHNLLNRGVLRRFKVGRLTKIPAADVHALVGYESTNGAA